VIAVPGTDGGAQSNRSLSGNRHRIANPDVAAFCSCKAGRHDVGTHQDLLVGKAVWNGSKICHAIRHEHEFGLATIDSIAELPSPNRLPAMRSAGTVLRMETAKRSMAVTTGRDRAQSPVALPNSPAQPNRASR